MRIRPVPLVIWSVVFLLVITTAFMMIVIGPQDLGVEPQSASQRWLQLVTAMSAATAGAVILSHHPENVIAWLFMALGLAGGATEVAISYAATCQSPDVCNLGLLVVLDALWFPTLTIGLGGLFLLFPHGKVPSGWRSWLWWSLVASGALGAATAFFQEEVYHLEGAVNPWVGLLSMGLVGAVADVAVPVVVLVVLVAILDFVLRARRASGIPRLQNRWLAYSGLLVVLGAITSIVGQEVGVDLGFAWSLATASIPVAVAFAITQHHLFEIDRLVSRTVSYSVVIGLLAGVFAVVVVGIPNWIPGMGDSPLLVAIGTLAVAAGFNPLHRQVQERVDRRFSRSRYDAQNVMDGFAGSLHRRVGTDEVIDGWVEVIEDTMEPAATGCGSRDDQFQGSWSSARRSGARVSRRLHCGHRRGTAIRTTALRSVLAGLGRRPRRSGRRLGGRCRGDDAALSGRRVGATMTSATRRLNVVTVGTASAVATVIAVLAGAVLARAGVDVVDETMQLSAISPRVRP